MKKKMPRNRKPTADDFCAVCGKPYAEQHEVFYGNNRENSQRHCTTVRLCAEHHRHDKEISPHLNPKGSFNKMLREQAQRGFENRQIKKGMTEDEARSEFIRIFGRNYLY